MSQALVFWFRRGGGGELREVSVEGASVASKRGIESDEVVGRGVMEGEAGEEGGAGLGAGAADGEIIRGVVVVVNSGGDVAEADWEEGGSGWWEWREGCFGGGAGLGCGLGRVGELREVGELRRRELRRRGLGWKEGGKGGLAGSWGLWRGP